MQDAITRKLTNHLVSIKAVIGQISLITQVQARDTVFYSPFKEALDNTSISAARKQSLRAEGEQVIRGSVQKAYDNLSSFLQDYYMLNTRSAYGVGSLPNGTEFYEACLRWHISMNYTAQEVHDIGLGEVARIKGLMEQIVKDVGFDGDLQQFFSYLKTEPRFYYNTSAQLLDGYRDIVYNRVKPQLSRVFNKIPSIPVVVEPLPGDGPKAMYSAPSPDGVSRPGTFYVNIIKPETRAKFQMMALSLHEAEPGHHFQISTAILQKIPDFRRMPGYSPMCAVPFKFPVYTSYVEGWGLYAEALGEDMGVYGDKYELFGRYSEEMWRACRLVVDTGIHAFGWSAEQAVDFIGNHTALPRFEIEIEVNRYITWPGQACAYKMGEIKLRELKQRALNKKLSLGDYHAQVLSLGAVPLQVLEAEVNNWIAENSAAAKTVSLVLPFCLLFLNFINTIGN